MDCDLLTVGQGYREILRKARKAHTCGDCKGAIVVGERYTYLSGIWDGTPENYSRCQDCTHLRCEIRTATDSECVAIDGLRFWLAEYLCTNEWAEVPRWVAAYNAVAQVRGGRRIDIEKFRPDLVKKDGACLSIAPL